MYDPDGTPYRMMDGSGWMTGFAVVMMLLLLIAVIAVLANLFLHVSTRRDAAPRTATALPAPEARVVLDARLARGEVAPEEYRNLRALLDS